MSKILEKVVLVQLQVFLRSNQIYEMFQSGFRKLHSTETALLKVYNDILMSTDAGNAVALILLDLSSAFDMVDHNLFLSRLKNCVGLRGTVLNWFQSFLMNRKFSVCTGQYTSSSFKFYLSHTRLYRDCITSSEMRVRSAPWTVQI